MNRSQEIDRLIHLSAPMQDEEGTDIDNTGMATTSLPMTRIQKIVGEDAQYRDTGKWSIYNFSFEGKTYTLKVRIVNQHHRPVVFLFDHRGADEGPDGPEMTMEEIAHYEQMRKEDQTSYLAMYESYPGELVSGPDSDLYEVEDPRSDAQIAQALQEAGAFDDDSKTSLEQEANKVILEGQQIDHYLLKPSELERPYAQKLAELSILINEAVKADMEKLRSALDRAAYLSESSVPESGNFPYFASLTLRPKSSATLGQLIDVINLTRFEVVGMDIQVYLSHTDYVLKLAVNVTDISISQKPKPGSSKLSSKRVHLEPTEGGEARVLGFFPEDDRILGFFADEDTNDRKFC